MPEWAKTILKWLVAAFLVYYIATQPEQFAAGVHSLVDGIVRLFRALAH